MNGNWSASLRGDRLLEPTAAHSAVAVLGRLASRAATACRWLLRWAKTDGRWWGTSLFIHLTFVVCLGFVLGIVARPVVFNTTPSFETTVDGPEDGSAPFDLAGTGGPLGSGNDEAAAGEPPLGAESDVVWSAIAGALAESDRAERSGVATHAVFADGPVAASSVEEGADMRFLGLSGAGSKWGRFNAGVIGSLGGRGAGTRGGWLKRGGGSERSEGAVDRGLRWLTAHQFADGSWRFDLKLPPCEGRCRDSGSEPSTTAATALALLAYLGHGETTTEGDYQDQVKRGLHYLTSRMKEGGDLREGTMYAQGLATMALAEACAMTGDLSLAAYAQKAVDFIIAAQDKKGGGWRYEPQMPGDTTVTGWQLLALKSAQTARLRVPYHTLYQAMRFLDSVQYDHGARYTYLPPSGQYASASSRGSELRDQTTTAVGLLCRIYAGWQRDHTALRDGVGILGRWGPSKDDLYYDYYATQVMHHWGGEPWQKWNSQLREHLIRTQATDGHESGSWNLPGGQSARGGRLYNTAMAIMTLEVYYRHLPLVDGGESSLEQHRICSQPTTSDKQ
ncbi:MAG TPA: hypothetical protein VG826_21525 [Pirellulales bacterium]|nr:hypothetical protein [Pirellulales bacterium]